MWTESELQAKKSETQNLYEAAVMLFQQLFTAL
jgi:hypothetical protein